MRLYPTRKKLQWGLPQPTYSVGWFKVILWFFLNSCHLYVQVVICLEFSWMSLRGSQLGQDLSWFENLVTGGNKMHLNCHHLLFACLVICRTGSIGRIGDERCKIITINTLYFTALHIMDREQLRHCSARHAQPCSSCTALPNYYTTLHCTL